MTALLNALNQIRIVLVATTHPGNIGATARAMKTMGLQRLYLVTPKYFPHADTTAMAAGADHILEQAVVCDSLEAAIAECPLVIGTSARSRTLPWTMLNAHACGQRAISEAQTHEVAIVFGQEKSGLSNEQLAQCHYHMQIPSDENFASLNVAAAVQVICYEIRIAALQQQTISDQQWTEELASSEDSEYFYQHLEQTLKDIGFLKPSNHRQLLQRLRRFYQRARLEKNEISILRGILTATQQKKGNP